MCPRSEDHPGEDPLLRLDLLGPKPRVLSFMWVGGVEASGVHVRSLLLDFCTGTCDQMCDLGHGARHQMHERDRDGGRDRASKQATEREGGREKPLPHKPNREGGPLALGGSGKADSAPKGGRKI